MQQWGQQLAGAGRQEQRFSDPRAPSQPAPQYEQYCWLVLVLQYRWLILLYC